jgi:hypothetical protein
LSAPDTSQRDTELRDRAIERIARIIVDRRLETPAVLFLEANRPLTFFAAQGALAALPLIGGFIPPADVEAFARVLDSQESLDLLIQRIETLAGERRQGAPNKHS